MKKEMEIPIDLSSRYRRQIYLVAFPLGALFSAGYLWISASKVSQMNLWIALGVSVLLTILFIGLWFDSDFLHTAESIFYFSMCLYFVIYSHSNINLSSRIHLLTEDHLSDVITGMGMWLIIIFIGAFLSLSTRQFRILMAVDFFVLLLVSSINLYLVSSAGFNIYGYLYRWLNVFFALFVAVLLIQRIARLQQIYASTDPLTGLLNRRAMIEAITHEMRRVDRYKKTFSLILFDADKFKSINDTFGHAAGDQALRELAAATKKLTREIDRVGRWGGEEFLILLSETNLKEGMVVAERICKSIHEFDFSRSGRLTISVGITSYISRQSLDELLHTADLGMYQAKKNGGDQVCVMGPSPIPLEDL